MKTLTLTFALFITYFVAAQNFAPIGATWHYSENFFYPYPYLEYFMKFEVTGDTIIDGHNCSIIHKDGKAVCYDRPDDEFVYSSNDTVFVYDQNYSVFRILYDFSANAGDSWEFIVDGFDPATDQDTNVIMVDSTDLVIINGQSLKRLFVTYQFTSDDLGYFEYPSTIIELLGDTKYMFNYFQDILMTCDVNSSGGLRCYEDSFLGFHDTGIADSCEYFELYNNLTENEQAFFSIAPNPSSDFIQIKMKQNIPDLIQIRDTYGRLVLETTDTLINVSDFREGIYFIQIQSEGKWSTERFSIIKP
jgi:hypothetical protein